MKVKMQLDIDQVFITPDADEIKISIPITQAIPTKLGVMEKNLSFKTGFTCFIKKECALDIIRQLKSALKIIEPIKKDEIDDLDER